MRRVDDALRRAVGAERCCVDVTSAVPLRQHLGRCAGGMTTTTRPRTRLFLAGLLALGLTTGVTACSGATDPTAGPTHASTGIGAQWGDCMRSAGFDIEDPSDDQVSSGTILSPAGVDQERFHSAADECAEDLGVHRADSAEQDKWVRQYQQVASCVREEYPDFPEDGSDGGISFDPDGYPPAREPAFQELAQKCMQQYAPDTQTQEVG